MCNTTEFLSCVREIVDMLMSIGDLVLHRGQIMLTIKALLTKYDSVVVATNSRKKSLSLNELESIILTQESRIEKTKKDVTEVVIDNLTEGIPQSQFPSFQNSYFDSSTLE